MTTISSSIHAAITPGSAVALTEDIRDADKAMPVLAAGTRAIVSYITGTRATVIVQPVVTAKPYKGGRRAGLTTTGGKMRTIPLDKLAPISDGWQFFEPTGCIGSRA